MVKNCCVPFCKNTAKNPDISFFKFPSNPDLRNAWVRAISRIDPVTKNYWTPGDSTFVCGVHFTPDQFSNSVFKRKQLLPKRVPCIFPGYPKYLLGNFSYCQRFPSLLSKNNFIPSRAAGSSRTTGFNRDASSVVKVISDKNSNVNINKECSEMKQTSSSKSSEKHPSVVASDEDNDVSCTEMDMECDGIEPIQTSRLLSTSINSSINIDSTGADKNIIHEAISQVNIDNASLADGSLQKSGSINNDLSTQKFLPSIQNVSPSAENSGSNSINCTYPNKSKQDCFMFKRFSLKREKTYRQLRCKLKSAKSQISRNNAKIFKLQELNKALTEKIKDYNIDKLEESIANNNAKAVFVIDQLCSLRKKNILWSTGTMEFATHFGKKFPEAYSFLRRTNCISLPSPKILGFNQIENDNLDLDSVNA